MRHKPFSLVLGGGATRGFYHLGVLQALRELSLKPAEIVGCSAGALIGAIAASDWERDYLKLAKDLRLERLVTPNPFTSGVLGIERFERTLHTLIPASHFEELTIPLKVNATDANTAEEIVFSTGEIFPPLLASMAVPAVFPLRAHQGRVLMDGGVVDILPVGLTRNARVIASDIAFPLGKVTPDSSKAAVLRNAAIIGIHHNRAAVLTEAERKGKRVLHLQLNDPMFGTELRKSKLLPVAQRGYDDTMRAEKRIRELLRR